MPVQVCIVIIMAIYSYYGIRNTVFAGCCIPSSFCPVVIHRWIELADQIPFEKYPISRPDGDEPKDVTIVIEYLMPIQAGMRVNCRADVDQFVPFEDKVDPCDPWHTAAIRIEPDSPPLLAHSLYDLVNTWHLNPSIDILLPLASGHSPDQHTPDSAGNLPEYFAPGERLYSIAPEGP